MGRRGDWNTVMRRRSVSPDLIFVVLRGSFIWSKDQTFHEITRTDMNKQPTSQMTKRKPRETNENGKNEGAFLSPAVCSYLLTASLRFTAIRNLLPRRL